MHPQHCAGSLAHPALDGAEPQALVCLHNTAEQQRDSIDLCIINIYTIEQQRREVVIYFASFANEKMH